MTAAEYVIEVLGGASVFKGGGVPTSTELRERIKRGLPYRSLESVRERLGLSVAQATSVLHMPRGGARRYGGRWTPRGLAPVFTSATLSLAALERFVHADPDLEPPDLVAIPVDIPSNLEIESLDARAPPSDWRHYPAPPILTTFGEQWLTSGISVARSVPSVVIPDERNYILNPRHPDFERLAIGRGRTFSFDPRMWKGKD